MPLAIQIRTLTYTRLRASSRNPYAVSASRRAVSLPILADSVSPRSDLAAEDGGTRPWLVVLTVCMGYFTANWAMAPVSSILPTISRDLDLSIPAAGWIMSAYFLTLVGTVLVMGRLGDVFGHARPAPWSVRTGRWVGRRHPDGRCRWLYRSAP